MLFVANWNKQVEIAKGFRFSGTQCQKKEARIAKICLFLGMDPAHFENWQLQQRKSIRFTRPRNKQLRMNCKNKRTGHNN